MTFVFHCNDLWFRNSSSKLAIFKNAFVIYELLVYYPWAVARFLESRMRVEASLLPIVLPIKLLQSQIWKHKFVTLRLCNILIGLFYICFCADFFLNCFIIINWYISLTRICMKYFCNFAAWNRYPGTHKRICSIN